MEIIELEVPKMKTWGIADSQDIKFVNYDMDSETLSHPLSF